MNRRSSLALAIAALLWIAGCATTLNDADRLERAGDHERALDLLSTASARDPSDNDLRVALLRQRELTVRALAVQADLARSEQRPEVARALLERLAKIDASHPRVVALRAEIDRAARQSAGVDDARRALAAGRTDAAATMLRQVLAQAPGNTAALQLQGSMRESALARAIERAPLSSSLGVAYQKPVTLEFRDAPLRAVLESLARTSNVNFVFDKDVRTDAKVSIFLKDVSVDDALKVILATQQLDRKVLNDSTLFVYPNTQAKQREHQELLTRSFYLTNADVKQAQALIRTMTKTRDMFVDERLNLIVVRDTTEVLQQVDRLLAALDLPEPEVMLEVEVLEIASDRIDDVGIQWPDQLSYGIPGVTGPVELGQRRDFRATIANPAIVATLRNSTTRSNVLANPRLRARNHEKAKVLIGEKLPVFTTTSTANVGVSASVSYLDVGLKLEVEPSVQLDNDVVMKVNLEVSSLISRVVGPQGSVAYQIGTRQATTSLRLRSGETQVLAGLIREEDRKGISGIPLLADTPLIGRLFGLHSDERLKTEVVLLITPRVVRNVGVPDGSITSVPSGVDASPGAGSLRLAAAAKVSVPPAAGTTMAAFPSAAPSFASEPGAANANANANPAGNAAPVPATPAAADGIVSLLLSVSAEVIAGDTAAVTLQNKSTASIKGEIEFDPTLMQAAQAGERNVGRLAFTLPPQGQQVFVLRTQSAAAGQAVDVSVVGLQATGADGRSLTVNVEGNGFITVTAP